MRLKPMVYASFFLVLASFLAGQTPFTRAKALIETNCLTCPGRSRSALEEGINLALSARAASNDNRAATLRLLVDGYSTLAAADLKFGTAESNEAFTKISDFLKELRDASPNDANIRYEYVHRFVGNVESMMADIDERITELRRILVLDPKHEKAQLDLARDLVRKGLDDEALPLLRNLSRSTDAERARTATQQLNNLLEMRSKSTQVVSPVRFSGEVTAGKPFEREFGPGLVFRLSPVEDEATPGWDIAIVPRDSPTYAEYSGVMTPPYRGMNSRYLFVGYGLSAREVVNGSPRRFRFVRTRQDYDRARQNVSIVLGRATLPAGKTYQDAMDEAMKDMEGIPYCTGSFRILDSRLAPGTGPVPEVIDWIKFEIELCGPERY